MRSEGAETDASSSMFGTLREDVRSGDFSQALRRDFEDLKEFMLDEQRKQQLSGMSFVRRWFYTWWWLFRSMFFRLTPVRRILLVAGIICVLASRTVVLDAHDVRYEGETSGLGVACILLVLMLELKDKLIAKNELAEGRSVQEALMPERTPRVPGWDIWLFTRSANDVGGDLVDFVKIDATRYGVAVADVAGKGLRAALLAAKLQATLRAIVADCSSLSELITKLNTVFCRDSLPSIFASFSYAEIVPGSGGVRTVNGGHPPAYIVRLSELGVEPKSGPALGLIPGAVYTEGRIELQPGESIVVYSDGLTEAKSVFGDFFGEQRLKQFLPSLHGRSAAEAGCKLLGEIDRFIGEARPHDDISIAILRYVG